MIFAVASCQQKADNNLEIFENTLGSKKSKVLSELTEDFEKNYLAEKYPSIPLSEQYMKFMEELEKLNIPDRDEIISQENDEKYKESGLIYEKYWYPDSVWIEGQVIKKVWSYTDDNGKVHVKESEQYGRKSIDSLSHDSIIKAELKMPDFNFYGDFKKAIKEVKDDSPFLKVYYELIDNVGFTSNSLWAGMIKENNLDITGPVERRVLVLELVY